MFTKSNIALLAITAILTLSSCDDLRDNYDDCGVWLEFVADHNMEYGNAFGETMRTVDVLVFDAGGTLYSSHHAAVDRLDGGKRMFLGDTDMPLGTYSVVAVAGLTEQFRLSATDGSDFVPGVTTVEQVALALRHTGGESSAELPHLWFGTPVTIDYKANLSVWKVPLVRETNRFSFSFEQNIPVPVSPQISPLGRAATATPLHTFEIVAPEAGAYDYLNAPYDMTTLIYRPHSLATDLVIHEEGDVAQTRTTTGRLSTMRLLADGEYILNIRDYATGDLIVAYDLIDLMENNKPTERPDGTPLPLQEYLDRQGDWNLVIILDDMEEDGDDAGRAAND